jgi:hypothetical protein
VTGGKITMALRVKKYSVMFGQQTMMSSFFYQPPVVLKSKENQAALLLDHQTLIPM